MKRSAIGIIGGMGPGASAYLYRLLIEKSVKDFGAKNNDDFPEIILHSIPVPDFISNNEKKSEALKMLKDRIEILNKTNISHLAIACNTAHILLPELQRVSSVSFVSIIDEVVAVVKNEEIERVGILATPSTLRSGLYQEALRKQGILPIAPNIKEYPMLDIVIRNVIGGKISNKDSQNLIKLTNKLKKQGAEGIILGCTELPLVFPRKYSLPVFNSVEILVQALLQDYYK